MTSHVETDRVRNHRYRVALYVPDGDLTRGYRVSTIGEEDPLPSMPGERATVVVFDRRHTAETIRTLIAQQLDLAGEDQHADGRLNGAVDAIAPA